MSDKKLIVLFFFYLTFSLILSNEAKIFDENKIEKKNDYEINFHFANDEIKLQDQSKLFNLVKRSAQSGNVKKEKKNTKKLQKKNEIGVSKKQDKNEFDNDLSIDNKPTNHLKNNPKSKTEVTKN